MSNIKKSIKRNAVQPAISGAPSKFVLVSIEGGVWACAPVSERPQVVLTDWRIYEVLVLGRTARSRHFVGYNTTDCEGRVSSAIVKFDPVTMRGVTESGRVYALLGNSGWNGDADYTLSQWRAISGVTDALDVTAEIKSLLSRSST